MLPTYLQILRVYGLPSAEVAAILRDARDEGCPGLRLLERDGEFAVCVQVSAPNRALAREYSEKWVQKLRLRFGDALYAEGEISLAQATLTALLQRRRLVVATDAPTGRLLGNALRPLPHSEAAFDFGNQTYLNAENAPRITAPEALLKRFPGDLVQAAAGRALAALEIARADHAVAYMPASVGQEAFVLLCDRRGAVAVAVDPGKGDGAVANHLLDLIRRRVLGLPPGMGAIAFRPGHERPLFIAPAQGQGPGGDTKRFSLRRARPKGVPASGKAYEPMLDFDTATHTFGTALDLDDPAARPAAKRGDIVFESAPAPQADGSGAPAAPAAGQPAPETAIAVELPPEGEAPEDAAIAAGLPPEGEAPEDAAIAVELPMEEAPQAAVTGGLPAEGAAPDAATVTPAPAAQNAAESSLPNVDTLFLDLGKGKRAPRKRRGNAGAEAPQTPQAPGPAAPAAAEAERGEPPHSLLDEEIPDLHAPALGNNWPKRDADAAASHLYGQGGPLPESRAEALRTHSLQVIEKSERRRRRLVLAVLALLLLILLGGVYALWHYYRGDLGREPAFKAYGTGRYDTQAAAYLENARRKQPDALAYLAFPGQAGELVYTGPGSAQAPRAALAGTSYLGAGAPGHTTIACGEACLAPLTGLEGLRANSGFTLYLPGAVYRYKVMAVYTVDAAEAGPTAFDPTACGDLSNYSAYLAFTLGAQVRSLFETGVTAGQGASFVTLAADTADGMTLCVTGRQVKPTESAALSAAAIEVAELPLRPAAYYAANGWAQPDLGALLARRLEENTADRSTLAEMAPQNDTEAGALSEQLEDLQQGTDALLARADQLIGLLDVASDGTGTTESEIKQSGGAGTLPDAQVDIPIAPAAPATEPPAEPEAPTEAPTEAPAPTQAPTEAPTEAPAQPAGSEPAAPAPTEAPAKTPKPTKAPADTPAPTKAPAKTPQPTKAPAPAAETINVTMNGAQQSLELVRCLAMIAQNELGPNAPAEAYKAQCVAAHCWILSQGGYPSVAGREPGKAALAAAQEVAHVLVTYNGKVAFTPYFASASKGTASSADVWGGERAWLQAVDSPYDEQAATNWHTSGATSETARFARSTLLARIQEKLGLDLADVAPEQWFTVLSTNEYGWVRQIRIGPESGGVTKTGTYFRETLLAGQSVSGGSLRSQCFTVTYDKKLDCFLFDVYGYGHGCGMSQWGAIGYARNGWDYAQILTHYFTGTTLATY